MSQDDNVKNWQLLQKYLGISSERFASLAHVQYELESLLMPSTSTITTSNLQQVCSDALQTLTEQVKLKKLFIGEEKKTSAYFEVACHFLQHQKAQQILNVEKLWKILAEEMWWRLSKITTYEAFMHIPEKETEKKDYYQDIKFRRNHETSENRKAQMQDLDAPFVKASYVVPLPKQGHESIRNLVFGYQYTYPLTQEAAATWWCAATQQWLDQMGSQLQHVVILDVDNVGKSLSILAGRQFEYPNTLFLAICGPGYKITSKLQAILDEHKDKLHMERVDLNRDVSLMNVFEQYLYTWYDSGYFKKFKDAADHAIACYAGMLHRYLPIDARIWVVSRDDGLEHPVTHLRYRGRRASRIQQQVLLQVCDEYMLPMQIQVKHFHKHFAKYDARHKESVNMQVVDADVPAPSEKELLEQHYTEKDMQRLYNSAQGVDFNRLKLEEAIGEMTCSFFMNDKQRKLHTLRMRSRRLGPLGFAKLLPIFYNDCYLTYIDMRGSRIGNGGVVALCKALHTNTTLTNLDLGACFIGDAGGEALASLFAVHKKLKIVDVRVNKIGKIGGEAIAKSLQTNDSITALGIRENCLGLLGSLAILNVLRYSNNTVCSLDLRTNGKQIEHAIAEACKMQNDLPPLQGLTGLDINGYGVDATGMKRIMTSLASVTPCSLTRLSFDYNTCKDEGALYVSKFLQQPNQYLVLLTLARNEIGDEGTVALAEALKHNCTLTWLDLQKNLITNEGAVALAEALSINHVVSYLTLRGNTIGESGAIALANMLGGNDGLITLDVSKNLFGPDAGAAFVIALATNKCLEELYLGHNRLSDDNVAQASQYLFTSGLCKVYLDKTDIRYNTLLSMCKHWQPQPIEQATIAQLYFGKNLIGEQGFQTVTDVMTEWIPQSATVPSCSALARLTSLLQLGTQIQSLDISSNFLGDQGVAALFQNDTLAASQSLAYLSLNYNELTEKSMPHVAQFLSKNQSLTSLCLGGNQIGDEGVEILSNALASNFTLTYLKVSNNSISSKGAAALGNGAMLTSQTLAAVDMENNALDDTACDALANAFAKSESLFYLNVEKNTGIGLKGILLLHEASLKLCSDYESQVITCAQVAV